MMHSIVMVLVIALATILTRALPFVIFNSKRRAPDFLLYLGKVLPGAIVGMLIVYCLKKTDIASIPYGLNEIAAFLCVALLQCLFKMSILSIVAGTLLYMYLVQSAVLEKLLT
ncbi:branched-chain amino acid transporter AzlD [Helicobacter sp. 12S02232-10]|uniref:branched-chain amino acid transporter permease n=1 Tax=Helicobacter sp. 12S02232-10 TaxID=1476197 RepID=UPI000BC9115C|nr:AzlD domain-containing protein [Helicobacter sp. 12S02232-10]PAF48934.1 branched-chain amino acid transporter AzlD [Helicobacter sp. 12S02232-10]